MKTHPLTAKNWFYVVLAALVVGFIFAAPFLGVIVLAALMAYLFYGAYEWLRERTRPGVAASLTFLFSLLVVVVPVILVLLFTLVQLSELGDSVATSLAAQGTAIPQVFQNFITSVDAIIAPVLGTETVLNDDGVINFLRSALPEVIRNATFFITSFVGSIPTALAVSIMYVMVFYEFLIYGSKITSSLVALSPFEPKITKMYLSRIGLMANAMAKGQLFISFVISVVSAAILSIFLGLGDYFFLMTVAFTVLNLIPLGCGIVVIPITIFAMMSGSFWPGLIALILYILASNLDAFIRPRIIPKSITLTAGLTTVAAFGGLALFGLMGVVYGPIVVIIVVTTIQMYLEYYDQKPKTAKKSGS